MTLELYHGSQLAVLMLHGVPKNIFFAHVHSRKYLNENLSHLGRGVRQAAWRLWAAPHHRGASGQSAGAPQDKHRTSVRHKSCKAIHRLFYPLGSQQRAKDTESTLGLSGHSGCPGSSSLHILHCCLESTTLTTRPSLSLRRHRDVSLFLLFSLPWFYLKPSTP